MYSQAELFRNCSRTVVPLDIKESNVQKSGKWQKIARIMTFYIPNIVIRKLFKKETEEEIQAWREKVSLCFLILANCVFLAGITYGINKYVCQASTNIIFSRIKNNTFDGNIIIGNGKVYKYKSDKYCNKNLNDYTHMFIKESKACVSEFKGQIVKGIIDPDKLEDICTIYWDWNSIIKNNFIVIDNNVYNTNVRDVGIFDDLINKYKGNEIPKKELEKIKNGCLNCFKDTFYAGKLAKKSPGCVFGDIVMYCSSAIIFTLIFVRFFLAIFYSWYSRTRPVSIKGNTPVILQVTCYSEGESGIKATLNSLVDLEYPENYKLIVVVADGQIKGSGETRKTPDIIKGLCEELYESEPQGYISLVSGHKRFNKAVVCTGYYRSSISRRKSRILIIEKIGNDNEEEKKGNRGKRDSQVIIISFFSKMFYNDRMSNLDVEIYKSIKRISTAHEPEDNEILLMVDADTKVEPDALMKLVSVFEKDSKVIGLCGETQILNKFESWVTQIQVFEYYISHHQSKTFESIFGGVTCLPGCFCCYRLKITTDQYGIIRNHGDKKRDSNEIWTCIPILANPIIVRPYSVYDAKTLHAKNLLHLGEDRYLTTLLMKNFYKKKLLFLPSAKCSTYVPADYKTLRSQRRRWINSTIHNMFELVMVDKLCGIGLFSMQFTIGFELFGTLTLPAAIFFTFILVISSIVNEPAWIPLIMLAAILGLPAILILLTTFSIQYIYWCIIYIIALPIWNFALPFYAFWRFDDFSWGDTRKVEEACANKKSNSVKKNTPNDEFDISNIQFVEFQELKTNMEK